MSYPLHLSEAGVLFYALTCAFFVVEVVQVRRWANKKPLNCMMCMTGWCSLVIALLSGHEWMSVLLMIAGIFVGAMFEVIKMRWL